MKDFQKHFLHYSKKERTGIIVLVWLIIATFIVPSLMPPPVMEADKVAFDKLRAQLAKLESADVQKSDGEESYKAGEAPASRSGKLFAFDPNTLPPNGWVQLGVRPRVAETIHKYLARGGRFRNPSDLYKIYGLRKEEVDRLIPFVQLETGNKGEVFKAVTDSSRRQPSKFAGESLPRKYVPNKILTGPIDINKADTSAFIALRGIGPRLASRIVHFREALGGFHNIDQVGETYGLPDSTFQVIRGLLLCETPILRTLDINGASIEELEKHPYISRPQANAIVRFREQHGAYLSVDQLLQISILTPEVLGKLRPYLIVK